MLGTMTFADTVDEGTAKEMLDVALTHGVTAVDTANAYAGGATEELLGTLLAGRRDEVELASKVGMPHPDAGDDALLSPVAVRRCVEASLRRLRTDRLDLLYLHQPDRSTPVEDTLAAVAELVAEGKVRSFGVSNYAAWQIADVEAAADRVGAPRPVVAQQLYNLLARRIEEEYVEFAAVHRLATMVYNPLGGGLLTGRHRFSERPSEGRFGSSRLAEMYSQRYWDEQLFDAVERLRAVADGAGLPMAELALRWTAHRDVVDSLLLGGSRAEQLQQNLQALAAGPCPPTSSRRATRWGPPCADPPRPTTAEPPEPLEETDRAGSRPTGPRRLRAARARPRPRRGVLDHPRCPFATERVARLGYDYVAIDAQHGLLGHSGVLHGMLAVDCGGSAGVVRVAANDPTAIGHALDAGARGIVVPLVNTAADAAAAVRSAKYPPHGVRSYGPMRSGLRVGPVPAQADEQTVVLAMIETADGLANVEEIAATPGSTVLRRAFRPLHRPWWSLPRRPGRAGGVRRGPDPGPGRVRCDGHRRRHPHPARRRRPAADRGGLDVRHRRLRRGPPRERRARAPLDREGAGVT